MTLTAPFQIQAREIESLEPMTMSCLDGLPPAHRAKTKEVVAAIRSFTIDARMDIPCYDNYAPEFAVVVPEAVRFESLHLDKLAPKVRPAAAIAYTALRSDGFIDTLAEREAQRRKPDDGDGLEIIGLRGALVATAGTFVYWHSERSRGGHIPKILDDIRVLLPKGQSNHARIEALEGVSHYLTHRLYRAFDNKLRSPLSDWTIRVLD